MIEDGRLFLATTLGKVLEVNVENGEAIERGQFDASFRFRPVVTPTRIIVTSQDGRLFSIKRE